MFATFGYHGVSIEELGAAVGISGPGVYRHYPSKSALLADLLVGISEDLLAGGSAEVALAGGPLATLERLVDRHLGFSLGAPDLISVHDRDRASLGEVEAAQVRKLQRAYVELWVDQLVALDAAMPRPTARARARAVFGLLNSTPHQVKDVEPALLRRMALAALLA